MSVLSLLVQLFWPGFVRWTERPRPGRQGIIQLKSVSTASSSTTRSVSPNCLIYLPDNYGSASHKWPLVIFLHGSGARGDDPLLVRQDGLPRLLDQGLPFSGIVVSPQCVQAQSWHPETVLDVVSEIKDRYRVDPDRISICGYSMGAYGAWEAAAAAPERFSAVLTVAGGADAKLAKKLNAIPIWAFHGDHDETVPIQSTEAIVRAIRDVGGAPRLDVLHGFGHAIQRQVFARPEVSSWLLQQTRHHHVAERRRPP